MINGIGFRSTAITCTIDSLIKLITLYIMNILVHCLVALKVYASDNWCGIYIGTNVFMQNKLVLVLSNEILDIQFSSCFHKFVKYKIN